MSGKKGMKHYGEIIINEVKEMVAEGKTQREIAEHFGFKDRLVIKRLLSRERQKEKRKASGIAPKPKGRPRKYKMDSEQSKDDEIKRLKMEIELLRSFLQISGRR